MLLNNFSTLWFTFMALSNLKNNGLVGKDDRVLLLNTGSGYKYVENIVE